jgi:hypothetical protein
MENRTSLSMPEVALVLREVMPGACVTIEYRASLAINLFHLELSLNAHTSHAAAYINALQLQEIYSTGRWAHDSWLNQSICVKCGCRLNADGFWLSIH